MTAALTRLVEPRNGISFDRTAPREVSESRREVECIECGQRVPETATYLAKDGPVCYGQCLIDYLDRVD